jgi:hypothetical protein
MRATTALHKPAVRLLAFACIFFRLSTAAASDLGVVLLDTRAPAEPGVRWPEAEERTRAELAAVGLSVVTVDATDDQDADTLDGLSAAAQRHRAVAGVRLVRQRLTSSVEIWIADEITGKLSVRRVSTKNLDTSEAVAVVALSVVELLNASLLELRAGHAIRGRTVAPEAVLRMVDESLEPASEPYRIAVRGGMAVAGSPGGLGLTAGPTLAFGFGPISMLAIEADVLATAVETSIEAPAGSARVGLGMGRLLLVLRAPPAGAVHPVLGVGGGALLVWARGEALDSSRYDARDETTTVALASAVAGVALHVSRALRLRVAFGASFAAPEVRLELAGQPAATAGRPLLDGGIGLEWVWADTRTSAR